MARQEETRKIGRREGSRWIHEPPEPDELAKWFRDNVRMHDGLEHAHYLPGITMIPNKERGKRTVVGEDGAPRIVDYEQLVYTPYPKVETRIAYFWDLMFLHPEWLGAMELVAAAPHANLPEGFFHQPVTGDGGRITSFIGVSFRARITERSGRCRPVIEPAAGTKIVPLLKSGYNGRITADPDAIHKAQTGAQGRALGYAGMLVVPGAGIATAEDMVDFLAGEQGAAPMLPAPTLPAPTEVPDAPDGLELGKVVQELVGTLESDFPQAYEEAAAWATEKGYELSSPPAAALRGLERQLRRKLEAAQRKQNDRDAAAGAQLPG